MDFYPVLWFLSNKFLVQSRRHRFFWQLSMHFSNEYWIGTVSANQHLRRKKKKPLQRINTFKKSIYLNQSQFKLIEYSALRILESVPCSRNLCISWLNNVKAGNGNAVCDSRVGSFVTKSSEDRCSIVCCLVERSHKLA